MYWLDIAGSVTCKSFKIAEHLKEWMIRAGFQNVTEKVYKIPIGGWPKDEKFKAIGQFNLLNVLEGVGMFSNIYAYFRTTFANTSHWLKKDGHGLIFHGC